MNKKLYAGFAILTVLLQTTFFATHAGSSAGVNLVLILVTLTALREGRIFGSAYGAAIGILFDILFSEVLGFYTGVYFIMGYLTGNFRDLIANSEYVRVFAFISINTIGLKMLYVIFQSFLFWDLDAKMYFDAIFSFELLLNIILAFVIYALMNWIDRKPKFSFGDDI